MSVATPPALVDAEPTYEFGSLGTTGANFQGGFILLIGHGCRNCGHGFWTEGDESRRLAPGSVHPCPHCGEASRVPE